jgi:hypothetical protein
MTELIEAKCQQLLYELGFIRRIFRVGEKR